MSDLISIIQKLAPSPEDDHELRDAVRAHIRTIQSSARADCRQLVQDVEKVVKLSPQETFRFDEQGFAMLNVGGRTWDAGCFETVSIANLRTHAKSVERTELAPKLRLWVLDGANPATDIGALQATTDGALFQVASQFNCLESPGPHITAISNYFDDFTQGPRASISAFPATMLRHYSAPKKGGGYFTQHTNGAQIKLLAEACGEGVCDNGYFTGKRLSDPERVVRRLEENFEKIHVGIHDGAQVVLGYNWYGEVDESASRKIAQVFTSTVAGGDYDGRINLGENAFHRSSTQLLRAAYLGTLLSAICLGRKRVVLTLIGGGVFQNSINVIWNSIEWALEQVSPILPFDLDVFLNGYNLHRLIDLDEFLPSVRLHHGAILEMSESALVTVRR